MEARQKNEIIYQELRRVYQLCTYKPSPVNWEQWLETLHPESKSRLVSIYTYETAWQKVFQFTHWYLQKHYKKEIDAILKLILMPEVFDHYKTRYKAIEY